MAEPAQDFDLIEYVKGLSRLGDTSLVVISVTTLEDWVEVSLKAKMRDLSSKVEDRLFTGYGPLSTFSAKIDIAYAFELFQTETYNDLRALKDIRNAFAHTADPVHFNTPTLAPLFQKLSGWTKDADPQKLFQERVNACVEPFKQVLNVANLISVIRGKPFVKPRTSRGKSA